MPIVSTPGQYTSATPVQPPVVPAQTIIPPVNNVVPPPIPEEIPAETVPDIQPAKPPVLPPRLQAITQPLVASPAVTLDEEDTEENIGFEDDDEAEQNTVSAFAPPPLNSTAAKPGMSLSRLTEDDRRGVISRAFQLVLGRDPADRDYSYYRFSTLTEDSLIRSLLNLPEHKQVLEKAKEHTSLSKTVSDLDLQVKQLTTGFDSMQQERQTMQYLLAEKNKYIQQMRGIPEGEQVILPQKPEPVAQQNKDAESSLLKAVEVKKLPTPIDEMKSMIKGLFGGK